MLAHLRIQANFRSVDLKFFIMATKRYYTKRRFGNLYILISTATKRPYVQRIRNRVQLLFPNNPQHHTWNVPDRIVGVYQKYTKALPLPRHTLP